MKKKSLLLAALSLCLLLVGLERLYYRQNGGFRIANVLSPVPPVYTCDEDLSKIDHLLDQPFRFLGSGGTSYVFLGEDQTTVLKLFKHQHLITKNFLFHLHFPGVLDTLRIDKIAKREKQHLHKRQAFFFNSCKLAYQHLKEETGLIFLCLAPNAHFTREIKLIDAWGIPHYLDLSQTEFALQKKADMLFPTLEQLLSSGRKEEVKDAIDSLLSLMHTRCNKGIGDRDPNLLINFGFVSGKAVEIDLGSYYLKSTPNSPFQTAQEIFLSTYALQKWLEKHSPDLLNYVLDQTVNGLR